MKEIGSFYELNTQQILDEQHHISEELFSLAEVEKYKKKNVCYTSSGRDAILLALKSIEKNYPLIKKKCLMPAYMCDSVFIPFEIAGWELIFYHVDKEFCADCRAVEDLLIEHCPGMVFVHPYYGMDTCDNLWNMLQPYREQGLFVMEDVTQAYYLKADKVKADFIIGSIRKWYAIPDGGFLACNDSIATEWIEESDVEFIKCRLDVMQRKYQYLTNGTAEKQLFLQDNRALEHQMDQFDRVQAISKVTVSLLSKTEEVSEKNKRCDNYGYLNQNLPDCIKFPAMYYRANKDCIGLYYPVYLENRETVQKQLIENRVYAPVLWPIGEQNEKYLSIEEQLIFDHMLALPMDQRYNIEDMKRIVQILSEAVRG